MPISFTALLGVLFLVLAIVTTYLMFHFWGYPYDEEKRRSSCPQWKMNIHRAFGYSYVVVYIVMMTHMLPRLWNYQVEFPARTVAHICFGITIGVVLLVKISILRWFRHLEEWMPALGMIMLLCTIILSGLSLPFAFKEQGLANARAFGPEAHDRLERILPPTGIARSAEEINSLIGEDSLRLGRGVLLNKCTHCHDLRTVIARPRTPDDWLRTVTRMAAKPAIGQTLRALEQQQVATYLIAITPELQESVKARRETDSAQEKTREALAAVNQQASVGEPQEDGASTPQDLAAAEQIFRETCSQCHDVDEVEYAPPEDKQEVDKLLARMIENGLEASVSEIESVKLYLTKTYVEKN